jgi:hypothetical protein
VSGGSSRFAVWIKVAQACILALSVCFSLGASDASSRFDNLGHRLMCTCGCAQLLGECDHYGCPNRGEESDMLKSGIARGQSDDAIMTSFAARYGATVLAAPTTHGFDLVGWIAPFAVFAAAVLGTVLLVRRWSMKPAGEPIGAADDSRLDPAAQALREKIRRETDVEEDRGA